MLTFIGSALAGFILVAEDSCSAMTMT